MKSNVMMNERLKKARLNAGFKTASAAIETLNWHSSTYRAHENGQNNFKVDNAKIYAEAYGVSASWLIMGDETNDQTKKISHKATTKKTHKHNCAEHLFAAALLLKDDDTNLEIIEKIQDCLKFLKRKAHKI